MAGRNGQASLTALPPGRRRFSAVPKTEVFEVEVVRGGEPTTIEITGYVKGFSPVWVEVQTQQAWNDYKAGAFVENVDRVEVFDVSLGRNVVPAQLFRENPEVEARFQRDMLLAVTRGLEEHEADVLARDGGGWREILDALGWLQSEMADEDAADPEAEGEEATGPTGAASSPSSRRRTARTTGSG